MPTENMRLLLDQIEQQRMKVAGQTQAARPLRGAFNGTNAFKFSVGDRVLDIATGRGAVVEQRGGEPLSASERYQVQIERGPQTWRGRGELEAIAPPAAPVMTS